MDKDDALIEKAKMLLSSRMRTVGDAFTSPTITRDYLILQLAEKQHEVFCCLFLTQQHELIEYREMFIGTIDGCNVYPREVAKAALIVNAAAVILAHNHPSGSTKPSKADFDITGKLVNTLGLFDIRILDHIIVGGTDTLSFAEKGHMSDYASS